MSKQALIFSVTGAKGGVGKSIFSANLACALLNETSSKILIIDMDYENCGDIANLMGVQKVTSLPEASKHSKRFSPQEFYSMISKHDSEISILNLYNTKDELIGYNPAEFDELIKNLSNIFNFIIIDAGDDFNVFSLKAYEFSSIVFFITTPHILSLTQAEKKITDFRSLQFSGNFLWLILNQFVPKGIVSKELVQKKLNKDILLTMPYEPELTDKSITDAQPFVFTDQKSSLTRCFNELARYIIQPQMVKNFRTPESASAIDREILKHINPLSFAEKGTGVGRAQLLTRKSAEYYDRHTQIKLNIHKKLIEIIDLKNFSPEEEMKMSPQKLEELRQQTMKTINQLIEVEAKDISSLEERRRIAKEVFDEALGLGPLEDLLVDESINEIMVNSRSQVYVEKSGKLQLTNCSFTTNKHLRGVIERIVAPIGRRIDEKTPMVDARLKDGSRVNAIIPPLSLNGPMITIRKFSKIPLTYKNLVQFGTLTEEIADFLRACIEARLNCVISGGTGTGKTTLLNVLAAFIPASDRIITIEDSAELQLPQEHVGRLESRPPNLQGENEVAIRDLVRNSLRMRPDRIVVGECRGAEALDMLQAMNTGHDGSLTTLHANTPRDCIQRLETLVMFSGFELPSKAIREQIASAIDMIVQISRFGDGTRKITHITEVLGMEQQTITLQDIFLYKQLGVDEQGKVKGEFRSTGLIPKFVETLKEKGIKLPKGLFSGAST